MAGASDPAGRPRHWWRPGRPTLGRRAPGGRRRREHLLVAEVDAVLGGDAYQVVADGPPGWLLLNRVAHSDLAALSELAARQAAGDESQLAVIQLANDVVALAGGNPAEALSLQRSCLIPLELDLLRAGAFSASEAAAMGRVALRSIKGRGGRHVEGA